MYSHHNEFADDARHDTVFAVFRDNMSIRDKNSDISLSVEFDECVCARDAFRGYSQPLKIAVNIRRREWVNIVSAHAGFIGYLRSMRRRAYLNIFVQ